MRLFSAWSKSIVDGKNWSRVSTLKWQDRQANHNATIIRHPSSWNYILLHWKYDTAIKHHGISSDFSYFLFVISHRELWENNQQLSCWQAHPFMVVVRANRLQAQSNPLRRRLARLIKGERTNKPEKAIYKYNTFPASVAKDEIAKEHREGMRF